MSTREYFRNNVHKTACEETARIHGSLTLRDKETTFLYKRQWIEVKGDRVKRTKARKEALRWARYLADMGKIQPGDVDVLVSWMCPSA